MARLTNRYLVMLLMVTGIMLVGCGDDSGPTKSKKSDAAQTNKKQEAPAPDPAPPKVTISVNKGLELRIVVEPRETTAPAALDPDNTNR